MKADVIPSFLEQPTSPVTLIPIDAIHPSEKDASVDASEDVIEHSEDVEDVSGEAVDVKDVSEKDVGVLKALIPSHSGKGWPVWAIDYLQAMIDTRTDGAASNKIGITFRAVYEQRLALKDFDAAVLRVRAYRDKQYQTELESVSRTQALKPGCTIERIFNLKALDPNTYRDKGASIVGGITINLGYQIPTTSRQVGPIVEAQYDE